MSHATFILHAQGPPHVGRRSDIVKDRLLTIPQTRSRLPEFGVIDLELNTPVVIGT